MRKNPKRGLLCWATALLFLNGHAQQIMEPTFVEQTIDYDVDIGYGVEVGDVDGDGKPDIILADKTQIAWYRNGDWRRFVIAENLTERDNVCLATRDINGDGQVEIAIGAQWNPAETIDTAASGAVFYLIRPPDPTQLWTPVRLHHEPTVHRMGWVRVGEGHQLLVLPLHGRGNVDGEGQGVRVLAYEMPNDPRAPWTYHLLDSSLRVTHNFDIIEIDGEEALLIGGKEGAKIIAAKAGRWPSPSNDGLIINDHGFGEIRRGRDFIAGIQPLHGHMLAAYRPDGERILLSDVLRQGHALACADLLGLGFDQVVAGWRERNAQGEMGVQLFVPEDPAWSAWRTLWIDQNGMACEDLKVADLDGDGRLDIIAAGRSSHNLKIYWNRSGDE